VMVADRPYGEFCDFYIISPEYFGYTLVYQWQQKKSAVSDGDITDLSLRLSHGPQTHH
jgi:hypothetical protein